MGLIDIIEYKLLELIDTYFYTRTEQEKDLEEYMDNKFQYENGKLTLK